MEGPSGPTFTTRASGASSLQSPFPAWPAATTSSVKTSGPTTSNWDSWRQTSTEQGRQPSGFGIPGYSESARSRHKRLWTHTGDTGRRRAQDMDSALQEQTQGLQAETLSGSGRVNAMVFSDLDTYCKALRQLWRKEKASLRRKKETLRSAMELKQLETKDQCLSSRRTLRDMPCGWAAVPLTPLCAALSATFSPENLTSNPCPEKTSAELMEEWRQAHVTITKKMCNWVEPPRPRPALCSEAGVCRCCPSGLIMNRMKAKLQRRFRAVTADREQLRDVVDGFLLIQRTSSAPNTSTAFLAAWQTAIQLQTSEEKQRTQQQRL